MHKVRLSKNNYQLVANNSGQSPVVLMDHYNETLDEEKRDLAKLVESSFYPRKNETDASKAISMHAIRSALSDDPELAKEILKAALSAVSD